MQSTTMSLKKMTGVKPCGFLVMGTVMICGFLVELLTFILVHSKLLEPL